MARRIITSSGEEAVKFGKQFATELKPGDIVCLFGDLGAGKTTFVKGIASQLAKVNEESVNSPTFVYLNIYQGPTTVYHFDLYRLKDIDEFLGMGFDEYLYAGGVACIEWSERIEQLLPANCLRVTLKHAEEGQRIITIE